MRQQLKRILCLFLLVFGFGFGWRVMGQTVALCNSSITVYLDSTGQAPIAVGDIDNGSTPGSIFSLNDSIFYCSDLGPQVVVLTVINGDTSSCSTAVTVEDTIRPQIECLDTLILIYGGGVLDTITITPSNVLISAWDNCDSTFLTFGLSKGTFIFSQDTICDSIKVLASDARNNKDSTYVVICFRTGCRKYSPFCADPFCWDLNLETVQLLSDGKHHIILPTTHEQNCEDKYFKLEWVSPFKPLGQRTYPGCYRLNGDDEDCQEVIDQDGCPIMAYGLALTDAGCDRSSAQKSGSDGVVDRTRGKPPSGINDRPFGSDIHIIADRCGRCGHAEHLACVVRVRGIEVDGITTVDHHHAMTSDSFPGVHREADNAGERSATSTRRRCPHRHTTNVGKHIAVLWCVAGPHNRARTRLINDNRDRLAGLDTPITRYLNADVDVTHADL